MKKLVSAILSTAMALSFATTAFAADVTEVAVQPEAVTTMVSSPFDFQNYTNISVNGDATISVAPDVAYIDFGVSSIANTSKEASELNKKNVAKFFKALKDFGIAEKDIQTSYYSVYPNYKYNENDGSSTITGYTVNHSIKVTVRDIEKVGEVIDLGVDNGVDINSGVTFDVENKDKYYEEALMIAIDKAVAKGEKMAKKVGVSKVRVSSIGESSSSYSPYYYGTPQYANVEYDKAFATTEVKPGNISIYASVYVSLEKDMK